MTVTRDAFIAGLKTYGTSHADAERRWVAYERQHGGPAIDLEPEDPTAREKETQQKVTELFQAFGGVVRSTSQVRRSKVAAGLPDLWVCFPTRRFATWWETKRPAGGTLSPAQELFRDDCRACGIPWHSGSRADAEAWLIARRWATRNAGGGLDAVRTPEPTRTP